MSEASIIEPHNLGFTESLIRENVATLEVATLRQARDKVEKEMIISAIQKYGGNIARAAEELGVSRPTLYDLIKKHDLSDLSIKS